MGTAIKDKKNNCVLCIAKTIPTISTIDTSKNKERIVLAKASIIEFASVNLETISPVRLVEKKDIGRLKICLMYPNMTSIDNLSVTKKLLHYVSDDKTYGYDM